MVKKKKKKKIGYRVCYLDYIARTDQPMPQPLMKRKSLSKSKDGNIEAGASIKPTKDGINTKTPFRIILVETLVIQFMTS